MSNDDTSRTQGDEQGPPKNRANDTTPDPADPNTWPTEHGGQSGPEPTRYGDWEKGGRCTDF